MLFQSIKTLFNLHSDVFNPHTSWKQALRKHGRQAMYVLLAIQIVLVPSHIFTTDFVDPASRFTALSILMRLIAVAIFLITIGIVSKYHLHPSWYYGVSMFFNALSDGYMASRSGMDYLVTHMLGLGVVLVGYAVLALWSLKHYLITMFFSVIGCVCCFVFFNDFTLIAILKEGGAFIFFFLIISPTLCYLRYILAKSEFKNGIKIYEQHGQISLLFHQLEDANEQLKQSFEELHQNQEEILAQRDMLADKNISLEYYTEKINKSISTAFIVQSAILPTKNKITQLFGEHFVLFMPKDTVSGDFYWVQQVGEKRVAMIADCTGHGVSGAFMTLIGISLLNKILEKQENIAPSEVLQILHCEIRKMLQQEQTNNNYGMDASIVVIERQAKIGELLVTFSGAKRPLYYAPSQDEKIHKLEGSRKTIGGFDNVATYFEDISLHLPEGSILYFASDGFADQHNMQRKKYTEKRLLRTLENNHYIPLPTQKVTLEAEIKEYMKGTEQRDDILVFGIKI